MQGKKKQKRKEKVKKALRDLSSLVFGSRGDDAPLQNCSPATRTKIHSSSCILEMRRFLISGQETVAASIRLAKVHWSLAVKMKFQTLWVKRHRRELLDIRVRLT